MRTPLLALATIVFATTLLPCARAAETCTTQAAMQPAQRDALKAAAEAIAAKVEANDQTGLRALTIAEYQKDFSGLGGLVASTSSKLTGSKAQTEQLYILDATTLQAAAGGANADAQFFCNLNHSAQEADFSIPQLPPGRYAFAMVRMESATPWRISLLLRADGANWQLAGLYPKPLASGGHEGLWYWQQARSMAAQKQTWNAWLYLQEAQALLQPAPFVSSSHLEKLAAEVTAAAPPALASGLSPELPYVLKGKDGTEFRVTSLATDDSLALEKPDVALHLKVDTLGDAVAARKRNVDAMAALVAAHPELRTAFHGMWVFADPASGNSYPTELAMTEIP